MRFPKKGEVYDGTIFRTFRYVGIFEIRRSPLVSSFYFRSSDFYFIWYEERYNSVFREARPGREGRGGQVFCVTRREKFCFGLGMSRLSRFPISFRTYLRVYRVLVVL